MAATVDHRRPVGRRGQGQDRRSARRARRHGRALPRRQQRRPHAGRERREDRPQPDPVRRAPSGQGLRAGPRHGHRSRRCWCARSTRSARAATCTSDRWLRVSEQAHLIMPYHRAIDHARERLREAGAIGTTGRGIGPAYEDKMARTGIRVGDLFDEAGFREALERSLREKNGYLEALLGEPPLAIDDILTEYRRRTGSGSRRTSPTPAPRCGRRWRAARASCSRARRARCSTSTTAPIRSSPRRTACRAAAAAGAGLPPRMHRPRHRHHQGLHHARRRRAVPDRADATRSASGCAPTATSTAPPPAGRGAAAGSTPSSCATRCALSGLDGLALTKLDVLTGIDPIRVCVAYEIDGKRVERPPATQRGWARAEPVYEDVPGWQEDLGHARTLDELPTTARRYLDKLVGAGGGADRAGLRRRRAASRRSVWATSSSTRSAAWPRRRCRADRAPT